jgi:membrane protease subunit HflK
MRRVAYLLGAAAAVLYLLTGVVQVRQGERAVVRRFGRVLEEKPTPGLWVGLPWGLDRVDRVEVDTMRSVQVGHADRADEEGVIPVGQLLTGDHNLVNVQVTLYYKVRAEEVADYVVQRDRVEAMLASVAESTMAEWVGARGVDEVLLRGKNTMRGELIERVRERAAPYRLGVEVLDARVAKIAPPEEVKADFDSVSRAQTRIATLRYQAEQEAASRRRQAESEVYRIGQSARAYEHTREVLATQDARRFEARLAQYRAARGRSPDYLRQIWQEERGKLFTKLKEGGQIDLLDRHLGSGGLDLMTAPRLPRP